MRRWQQGANRAGRAARIDQIVDDQGIGAVVLNRFEKAGLAAILMVVGDDADRIYQPHLQLASHDAGRHHAAARHRDDPPPGAQFGQTPGQSLGIAMQLIPGDRKGLVVAVVHPLTLLYRQAMAQALTLP